jgi:hypothetical protein
MLFEFSEEDDENPVSFCIYFMEVPDHKKLHCKGVLD